MQTHTTETEYCQGIIERITFYSEESGFCVLRVKAKGQRDLVTVTAKAAAIHAGEFIECGGNWINDKKFGLQFKAIWLKSVQPSSLEGIEKYLGSGLIKGIGPVFASKLVKGFGADIFEVIDKEPSKLLTLEGIGPKRVEKITSAWVEQKAVREIMVFLQSHGVGTARAVRIYKVYKEEAIAIFKANPYRLADDIHGIGFKTADQLAEKLGIEKHSLQHAQAGGVHVLKEFASEGHCAAERERLIQKSVELLEIPDSIIQLAIEEELKETRLIADNIRDKSCLYVDTLYYAETGVARQVARLIEGLPSWGQIDADKALAWAQTQSKIALSPSQQEAVKTAINNKFTCITGGPGVGKTTIVKSIIQIVLAKKTKIALCAPTGRAAKRLSESTGLEANTIHRLLEFDPAEFGFKRNADSPLDADLLVIDEASMVDISLMNSLLKALPDHTSVLIVGDIDQLPSVGPGAVLADLIASTCIPTIRLTEIFRQAAHSKIIVNAHRINEGKMPLKSPAGEPSDFHIIRAEEVEAIYHKLSLILLERLPSAYKLNPVTDVQILTPMNRGGLGAKSLNIELQKLLNPNPVASITKFGWTFATGDKVIQTINDYDKEVFNGDLGFIKKINHEESEMSISFDGREIIYDFNELDALDLAYATTIHKSQGSEYPAVIIPICMQHYMMLQRNLLYTGVTRGKQLVILIGQTKAIAMAVKNSNQKKRMTKLAERITQF